jgi:hypothetical protein
MTFNLDTITPLPSGTVVHESQSKARYVLITEGAFGMTRRECSWVRVVKGAYAQYPHVLKIQFREVRKRTSYETSIKPDGHFALYLSSNAPPVLDWLVTNADGSRVSKYASFDDRYLAEWLEHSKDYKAEVAYNQAESVLPFGHYRVVYVGDTGRLEINDYADAVALQADFGPATSVSDSRSLRVELRGHPVIRGLVGPCSGGETEDGRFIVRYETESAYHICSH